MANLTTRPVFAVWVENRDCDDLSAGILDRVLPDELATAEGMLCVIDDSGEDDLYPATGFVILARRRRTR
jgi:hypothetical protein